MEAIWLATQVYPQNDWSGWQNGVNDDVCAPAPFLLSNVYPLFSLLRREWVCHQRPTCDYLLITMIAGSSRASYQVAVASLHLCKTTELHVSSQATKPYRCTQKSFHHTIICKSWKQQNKIKKSFAKVSLKQSKLHCIHLIMKKCAKQLLKRSWILTH